MAPTIQFADGLDTLVANGPNFDCYGILGLYLTGPSRGSDIPTATDGSVARNRRRSPLTPDLAWILRGYLDIDGGAGASDYYQQLRANLQALNFWFDSHKSFTVTLTDVAVYEGEARHEQWGTPTWNGRHVLIAQQITVPDGVLSVVL